MRQDRTPKPRPPGFRNNFSFGGGNSAGGNSAGGNSFGGNNSGGNSGRPFERPRYPQQSRPAAPRPVRPRSAPGPMPVAKAPDRWKERRQMMKAAAWRLGKLVHQSPAAIIASANPAEFIREPDIRARQLVKKIIRLRNSRNANAEK